MNKTRKITEAQLAALREYHQASPDGTAPCLTGEGGSVRLGTHVALLDKGLLEVAVDREPRREQHTYGYNFGRVRVTKSHLVCDCRFRLTDAGLAAIGADRR